MKKKQVKQFISLCMAAVLALSLGAFVSAEGAATRENVISPRFVAISDCGNLLELENSWGKLYCLGYTDTYPGYYAKVTVELQQMNGRWETIKTWTDSPTSDGATVSEYYYVSEGEYQLKVTHQAYNSNWTLADEFISYSDLVQYE
ncbi:MAG: hypothetical protein IKL80_05585 [Clostridia bacterium]|nr:hypothetical protein [Clostridia bacterium]